MEVLMTPLLAVLAGIAPFIIILLGYYSGLWFIEGEPIAFVGFGLVVIVTAYVLLELHHLDMTNQPLHMAVKVVMFFSGSAGAYVLYRDVRNKTMR